MVPEPKIKLSLMEAANHLQEMMQMIDDGHEIDEYLGKHYLWLDDQVTASVDRRKFLLREVSAKVETLNRMKAEIHGYLKRLSKVEQSVRESTKQVLLDNPKANIRDSIGNKISLCKSKDKLEILVTTSEKVVKNLIDDKTANYMYSKGFGKYLVESIATVLDVESMRKDLENGEDLIGLAFLTENTYVRGL